MLFISAGNDIALIRLPRLVKTVVEDAANSIVNPVCLGWNDDIKMPNPQFRLSLTVGWGKTNNEKYDTGDLSTTGVFSSALQKVYVPIIPTADCRRKHLRRFPVKSDQHICAGDEGTIVI